MVDINKINTTLIIHFIIISFLKNNFKLNNMYITQKIAVYKVEIVCESNKPVAPIAI